MNDVSKSLLEIFGLDPEHDSTMKSIPHVSFPLDELDRLIQTTPSCDAVADAYNIPWLKGLSIGYGTASIHHGGGRVVGFVKNGMFNKPGRRRCAQVSVDGVMRFDNTLCLLARMMLLKHPREDVTVIPDEARCLIQDGRLVVETPATRQKLIESNRKKLIKEGDRDVPKTLIDGRRIKKGYSIKNGIIHGFNGAMKVRDGKVSLISHEGKEAKFGIGLIAASTYPSIYGMCIGRYQQDHINGNPYDHRLENFRMVTNQQNNMVRDTTQEIEKRRPRDDCSHNTKDIVEIPTRDQMDTMMRAGDVKMYNGRWWHRKGIVWRKQKDSFVRVSLPVHRYSQYVRYDYKNKTCLCHVSIMHAFGKVPPSEDHVVVNHKDRNRQNFALSNLEWTTRSGNCEHKIPCVVLWEDGTVENLESMTDCSSVTGIDPVSVRKSYNVNVNGGTCFSTSKHPSSKNKRFRVLNVETLERAKSEPFQSYVVECVGERLGPFLTLSDIGRDIGVSATAVWKNFSGKCKRTKARSGKFSGKWVKIIAVCCSAGKKYTNQHTHQSPEESTPISGHDTT
jgi:hypothetical protein